MIKLLVDESYAFDYLSILELKSNMDPESIEKKNNYLSCLVYLRDQLGSFIDTILNSNEYQECYEANKETFLAVDSAKKDIVKASYVDRCNYRRHVAKQDLQKKLFNNEITETKIGYEVYHGSRSSI